MEDINNFFIDKKRNGHQNCFLLKCFIEKFVENKEIRSTLDDLSKILKIPVQILKNKSKQVILSKFNFKKEDSILKIRH